MAARTLSVRFGSTLCVLLLLSSASSVSFHRRSHQPVVVSYFPNSHNNFGFRAELTDTEIRQRESDVLQLKNDLGSGGFRSSVDVPEHWNLLHSPDRLLQFRRKRAIRQVTTTEQVAEDKNGTLIDFVVKLPTLNLVGRRFSLNTTSGNPEMFEVNAGGQLKLRNGFHLDYEVGSMKSITFVVHATSTTDPTDVYEISATLTVTNVDEPPVFETQPQPYLATVRANSGSGVTLFTLVAKDPEGATVQYEKTAVSPNSYNNRIELRSQTVSGVRECQLRTVGSASFEPEGQTISITVSARDATNGGQVTSRTVQVLIGIRPPQFYQSSYQGAMPEKNLPQQTVYKVGTSEELRVEWKTFQQGPVTLSLTGEGGSESDEFEVRKGSGNMAYIVCKSVLDYETANPKTKALTLRAVQKVGSVDFSTTIAVTVKIEDTNDNKPVFEQVQYLKTVEESLAVGSSVMDVTAKDKDTGLNAQIEYSLVDGDDFEIVTNPPTGDPPVYVGTIKVKRRLDFDRNLGPFYVFQLMATDKGTPPKTGNARIQITVTNVNDEAPEFVDPSGQTYQVQEDAQVGRFIADVEAADRDGDNVTYSFADGSLSYQKFAIDSKTGSVRLTQLITANDDLFNLTIMARDDGSCCPSQKSTVINTNQTTIYVQVFGANDNRPDFKTCSQYSPSVDENSPNGTSVIRVTAVDSDRGPNGVVTYTLIQGQDVFSIDPSSGLITVLQPIDRETTSSKQVTVQAKDGGQPPEEGYCSFSVSINDVNDNAPRFDKNQYVANITLGLSLNVPFVVVRAYDYDVGDNAAIIYSLTADGEDRFLIIPENGFISLKRKLNSTDAGQTISLVAMAKDEGLPRPLNTTVEIRVNVGRSSQDVKPPLWDQDYNTKTYDVPETAIRGTVVISDMQCDSQSSLPQVEFQLIKADGTAATATKFFYLVSGTNNVTVLATGSFDYTQKSEHTIRIRCVNFGSVTLSAEVNPKVILQDTNNQIPVFQGLSGDGRYSASVQENKPPGTSVATVRAIDTDSTPQFKALSFEITKGNENFTIEPGTKENTAVIRTRISFDRETVKLYFVTVKAKDGAPSSLPGISGRNTATVNVIVAITDVNDNDPYFEKAMYYLNVSEDTYINDLIFPPIEVKDKDESDRGRHTYRITAGNTNNAFGIRNGLGNLFPRRKLDYELSDKSFLLTVEASDGLNSASTTVSVTVLDVNDNKPVFQPNVYLVTNVTEEDNNVPRLLIQAVATDADVNRQNQIRYSLEGSSFVVSNYFSIEASTGRLYLNTPLDRDLPGGRASWQFTIKAADELENPNFGYATVSVMPQDLNDNKPIFLTDPLEASVPENSLNGTPVVRLKAVDYDNAENGTIVYSISTIVDGANVARPGYFFIDSDTGRVTTNTPAGNLDRETQDTYKVTIVLRDKGTPPKQDSRVLTISLSDINDQWPVFEKRVYKIEMSENQKAGEVIRVVARDNDTGTNANIYYVLTGDNMHFTVKNVNNQGSIQIENAVNYEDPNQRFFNLTVKAQDNAAHDDTCIVKITVLDFNDNTPVIQPATLVQNVSEDASPGTHVATFTARDDDVSDINKAFEFSISRASDPRRHFSIDSKMGVVKVRRKLDRETQAVHDLVILAIDKGSPPLTGIASLTVVVEDVNDNYPTFLEDYRPQVLENKDNINFIVQVVSAKDPDAPPYGAPFGFQLAPCASQPCDSSSFNFRFDSDGAGKNGTAVVSTTNTKFDREAQKYYMLPIVMWDMRGVTPSTDSRTGTNTLTITIADENDSPMYPGTQHIFVYNYEGKFGPVNVGRVYVQDEDDWDLPDKTFTYTGPAWMKVYFLVDSDTGMVTMNKGVPPSPPNAPYKFTVKVFDQAMDSTVESTVSVTVEDLTEEAVRNSGATRFKGTSAEEFIKVPKATSNDQNPQSPYEKFRALLAGMLNTAVANVQIISVQGVQGGYTDVRYSVHGSPYYPASQSDSVVALNKTGVENELKLKIEEVPIDACAEEVFEGGCYNYMDITGKPAMVNTNGTSFVGVEVFIRATEGCRALDFPDPNECSGDYCYHGGTCVKNDFGVLSCTNCPEGFDGPRCQQMRHSFSGNNYALYSTLEQCEDSHTAIEFITTKGDGMLLYNGPATQPAADSPQDFLSLELAGGFPVLNIDHGSGPATLSLDGRDQNNTRQVIASLADGKWHKIDIVRKGKHVEMIVDDCRAAGSSGSETQSPDTTPCRVSATSQGENSFLNVANLLQVGGRAPGHTYPGTNVVKGTGFDGCVRNLRHNSKFYDLHFKPTPAVPSGENGCPREDKVCEQLTCGANGTCTASLTPAQATCTCKPGWRGNTCADQTPVRELKTDSFLLWRPKADSLLPSYELDVQVMYRTWDTHGVLFTVSTPDNTKRVTVELKDGRLQALYNLDNRAHTLLLNNTAASDGFWHVARFTRVMHVATLTLDQGEGRNYASLRDVHSNVHMKLTPQSPMYGGAVVTSPSGARVVDRDLKDTCIQDVRVNGHYLPIQRSENSLSTVAEFVNEQNVQDGCNPVDGCVVRPPTCPPNSACLNLFGKGVCRCVSGYHSIAGGACQSDCLPDNPCFLNVPCSVASGSVTCNCTTPPWMGPFCNIYPTEKDAPIVGIAGGTIAAIVVSIALVLLLILVALLLVKCYMRKKEKDDFDRFVVEDDADFDIRENVMFYDEEGAGEEDQNAFDLTKLPIPAGETMGPPGDVVPRAREPLRGRQVPDDRPDVGDVLHDRMYDADDDPDAPPHDTLVAFNEEGHGSDAGSLSSLGSSSSDASQDYDYLHDWGPKFAKLADMYGAGQE